MFVIVLLESSADALLAERSPSRIYQVMKISHMTTLISLCETRPSNSLTDRMPGCCPSDTGITCSCCSQHFPSSARGWRFGMPSGMPSFRRLPLREPIRGLIPCQSPLFVVRMEYTRFRQSDSSSHSIRTAHSSARTHSEICPYGQPCTGAVSLSNPEVYA